MWQDKLKEMIYILENSKVNEIEASFWGRKYRVVKNPGVVVGGGQVSTQTDSGQTAAKDQSVPVATQSAPTETNDNEKILSPMPGTFYVASNPESPSYVKVGDKVSKGDTLCIIEAMKIMNEIEAEQDGEIKTILVNDGQPVEYNQPLFEIV